MGPEESLSGRCVISVARWLQEERAGVGVGGICSGKALREFSPRLSRTALHGGDGQVVPECLIKTPLLRASMAVQRLRGTKV